MQVEGRDFGELDPTAHIKDSYSHFTAINKRYPGSKRPWNWVVRVRAILRTSRAKQ